VCVIYILSDNVSRKYFWRKYALRKHFLRLYILRKLSMCKFPYNGFCIKAIRILRMHQNIMEHIYLLLAFLLSFLNLNYLSYRQCMHACELFTTLISNRKWKYHCYAWSNLLTDANIFPTHPDFQSFWLSESAICTGAQFCLFFIDMKC
jgi:hypothetical protein